MCEKAKVMGTVVSQKEEKAKESVIINVHSPFMYDYFHILVSVFMVSPIMHIYIDTARYDCLW